MIYNYSRYHTKTQRWVVRPSERVRYHDHNKNLQQNNPTTPDPTPQIKTPLLKTHLHGPAHKQQKRRAIIRYRSGFEDTTSEGALK